MPGFLFLALALSATHGYPVPQPLVGDALPAGAVARLGPQAFRYAGWGGLVRYSPDSKRVAVSADAGVSVFDAATGERLLWVPGDGRTVTTFLGFTTSGEVVASCRRRWNDSNAGAFRIDLATGKVTARFQPPEQLWFVAASPDGKVVFARAGNNEYTAQTVANELDTGKELWRKLHPEMSRIRPSPDGSRLVTWSASAQLGMDVLDAATGKTVERFVHPERDSHPCGNVAVAAKAGRVVVAHSWQHGFSVFETGTEGPVLRGHGWWYDTATLTADGKTAVFGRGRGGDRLEVWDLDARKLRTATACPSLWTFALAPDGGTIAAAPHAHTGMLQLLDPATGKPRPGSPEPFDQAAVVWYLPNGTLASADEKLTKPVKWDAKTGAMTPLPVGTKPPAAPKTGPDFKPPEGTTNVVASPDGKRAVGFRFDPDELDSSPGDTYLGLFDATGGLLARFERPDHTDGATWAFSADGKTFAIARGDGTITLFDAIDGKELHTFRHGGGVTSLAFSPDAQRLATACGDGPILVWDLGDGKVAVRP